MSGLDKNRLRNQTVCFRVTPEERQQIEARITVSGMSKGQYYIQSLLHQQINIIVGKYQSDRLSLEIRRLRERLDELNHIDQYEGNEVLTDCMIRRLSKSGAEVRLNTEATPELVEVIRPDVIVAALGAEANQPDFLSDGRQNVMMALDVFRNPEQTGKQVVIVGGGLVGCELALCLGQLGKEVTVVDKKTDVCRDAAFLYREGLLMELDKARVDIRSSTQCLSASEGCATVCCEDGSKKVLQADTVILATGFSPLEAEAERFRELAYDFWKIGDCFQVRKIFNARREGYNAGAHI